MLTIIIVAALLAWIAGGYWLYRRSRKGRATDREPPTVREQMKLDDDSERVEYNRRLRDIRRQSEINRGDVPPWRKS